MAFSNHKFSSGNWTSRGAKNSAAFLSVALASAFTLSACSSDSNDSSADSTATASTAVAITDASQLEDATHYNESDADYKEADVTDIALDGDTASASGANPDAVAVDQADGEAVITITGAGTYRFAGELSGHVIITADAADAVQIILNGASITSDTDAAMSITEADEATVIVAQGTENLLTDGSTRDGQTSADADAAEAKASEAATASDTATDAATDDTTDVASAALYSKADLTITGTGSLTVDGTYEDGIHSKDGLVITGPSLIVNAADDGIIGKDYLVLVDGTVDVTSVDTGFGSDNEDDADRGWLSILGGSITVDTGDDAIKAENALAIADGTVVVTASEEAVEAANIKILGGDLNLVSADDGINAAGGYGTESSSTADGGQGGGGQAPGGNMPTDMPTDGTMPTDGQMPQGGGGQPGGDRPTDMPTDGQMPQGGGGQPGGTMPTDMPTDGTAQGGGGMGGGMDQAGNQTITISGGTIVLDAGGDGIDSNGSVTMTGGDVTVNGPTNGGNGSLDFASTFDISGGTLLAIGSSGMAEAPDTDSEQTSLSITLTDTVNSGATLAIADADGNIVTTFTTIKEIQHVVFSSSDITSGTDYTVYQIDEGATDVSGGTAVGTGTAGEYTNAMQPGGGQGGPADQGTTDQSTESPTTDATEESQS